MYSPLNYESLNEYNSSYVPSTIKPYNNMAFSLWERSLFQRACSNIIFDNLPSQWSGNIKDFLYYCLFKIGYVSVFNRDENGLIFQPCTLNGYNIYYQPTNVLIANPALPSSLDLKIGEECELIKLTPDYMGIWDVISYYSEKLANIDNAINTAIINSKMAWMVGAKNKAAAAALQTIVDKINSGEAAVFYDKCLTNDVSDKSTPFQLLELPPIKENYILDSLLREFQTILNSFDSEIGIPTIPYEKAERLVTAEAESKTIDSAARSIVWLETLNSSLDNVNIHYGLNIKARLRYTDNKASEVIEND